MAMSLRPWMSLGSGLVPIADVEVDLIDRVAVLARQKGFEFVYLLQGTHRGVDRFKIGKARDVTDRLRLFNVKIPFDIHLLGSVYVADALGLERRLHLQFKEQRVGGEWFDLSEEDRSRVLQIGMAQELSDVAVLLEGLALRSSCADQLPDAQYIERLEALLALHGIPFNRDR